MLEEGNFGLPIRDISEYIVKELNPKGNLDLICSKLELYKTMQTANNASITLNNKLDSIKEDYDIIILDCPPTMSIISEAAFFVSNYVLIPVMPEFLCTIGLPLLCESIHIFNSRNENQQVEILGTVINGKDGYYPEGYNAKKDIKKVCKDLNIPLFKSKISYSESYPKSARMSKPIFQTSYTRWWIIEGFYKFVEEFIEKVGI